MKQYTDHEDHDSTDYLILFGQIIGDLLKEIDWPVMTDNRLSGRIEINLVWHLIQIID